MKEISTVPTLAETCNLSTVWALPQDLLPGGHARNTSSIRHLTLNQMAQLALFNVEEKPLYSDPLRNDQAPNPNYKRQPRHPLEEANFCWL